MDFSDLSIPETLAAPGATGCKPIQCWTPQLLKSLLLSLVRVETRLPRPGPRGFAQTDWIQPRQRHANPNSKTDQSPPSEDDVTLLLKVHEWMLWLDEPERHLLRMHAKGVPRDLICRKLGISRSSVWRHWMAAINKLVNCLNCARIPPQLPRSVR